MWKKVKGAEDFWKPLYIYTFYIYTYFLLCVLFSLLLQLSGPATHSQFGMGTVGLCIFSFSSYFGDIPSLAALFFGFAQNSCNFVCRTTLPIHLEAQVVGQPSQGRLQSCECRLILLWLRRGPNLVSPPISSVAWQLLSLK